MDKKRRSFMGGLCSTLLLLSTNKVLASLFIPNKGGGIERHELDADFYEVDGWVLLRSDIIVMIGE